jgi:putative nucleotidyltransferase with HDIG domain
MLIKRKRCLRAFGDYVAAYDPADPKIALKIAHTYRVADLCEGIALDEGMCAEDVDVAWLCGLLHDIGRFEQVRRYGTFSDARSVSHAALGVSVLLDEGRLWDFVDGGETAGGGGAFGCRVEDGEGGGAEPFNSPVDLLPRGEAGEFAGFIATVIGTHSDYRLPQGLDARTREFCDILRDADKVDILKAVGEADVSQVIDYPMDVILASDISPNVQAAFCEHRTLLRAERSTPADMLVSYACFLFEMSHTHALRAASDQGYVWRLLATPFANPHTAQVAAEMAIHLREWVDERVR